MEDKDLLKNAKEKILSSAISFITVIEVVEKQNFDGSINLYIQTDNLKTVELNKLLEVAEELSTERIDIQIVQPDDKMLKETKLPNEDTISVYIELNF